MSKIFVGTTRNGETQVVPSSQASILIIDGAVQWSNGEVWTVPFDPDELKNIYEGTMYSTDGQEITVTAGVRKVSLETLLLSINAKKGK